MPLLLGVEVAQSENFPLIKTVKYIMVQKHWLNILKSRLSNKSVKGENNMENYFEQLVKIYNTLLVISTKGEDTVAMAQCLSAMRDILMQLQNQPEINTQE
jgi:hypothetical protein